MTRGGKSLVEKKHIFRYRAEDPGGRIRVGRATAPSSTDVRRLLQKKDYNIISIVEEKKAASLALPFSRRVSVRDRSIFYRELATMLKAGVSITQAIEILAESPSKGLQKVLKEILSSLQNGFPLSVAMAGHHKVFPQVEIGVVKAGEATGNLSKVLVNLAETTARSAEFISRVRGAMIYPAFIVVVMIIIGLVILVKVIPPIKDIFASTETELPASTRILLAFTDFVIHRWWLIIIFIVGSIIGWKLFGRTKPGKQTAGLIALNFPVFGTLNRQVYLARFNRTLTLLITAGVPIIEAVKIVADSTSNIIFRQALQALIRSLEQGSSISVTLQGNKYFPRLMTQLLYIGQQSGDLGGTTATLADFFEEEVDGKLRSFSALIEPFIIATLGLVVGFVIVSVLQPIYNLTGEL